MRVVLISTKLTAEDLISANSELRGRINVFMMDYWPLADLEQIPKLGFSELGLKASEEVRMFLSAESLGCPSLLQRMCLEMCIRNEVDGEMAVLRLDRHTKQALQATARACGHDGTYDRIKNGPQRGQGQRGFYEFVAGGHADAYEVLLRALGQDPAALDVIPAAMANRISRIVKNDRISPGACKKLMATAERLALDGAPNETILEWREPHLAIHDPYFLFFVRWGKWADDRTLKVASQHVESAVDRGRYYAMLQERERRYTRRIEPTSVERESWERQTQRERDRMLDRYHRE